MLSIRTGYESQYFQSHMFHKDVIHSDKNQTIVYDEYGMRMDKSA